jgi:hypothetical protein
MSTESEMLPNPLVYRGVRSGSPGAGDSRNFLMPGHFINPKTFKSPGPLRSGETGCSHIMMLKDKI